MTVDSTFVDIVRGRAPSLQAEDKLRQRSCVSCRRRGFLSTVREMRDEPGVRAAGSSRTAAVYYRGQLG
eukprot:325837-Prymnesium_polylepis.1